MTRDGFKQLYETIFGEPLKKSVTEKITKASTVRDCILHGKGISDEEKRKAIVDIFDYAQAFNIACFKASGLKPFGSTKGFKGRATSLDKSTSRWILKGVGLTIG
jgi:hypothetical protein